VKRTVIALALLFLLAACSGGTDSDASTTSTLEPAPRVSTTATSTAAGETTVAETTTSTVVTGNATFIIGSVIFGDQGTIEGGNLGPDAGDLTGYWIAIDPFYLELPSTVLAPGTALIVSVAEDADPTLVVSAAGLLPVLKSGSGEIGLYRSGAFGNPEAMVDYIQWGTTPHTRTAVAVAASLWQEDETIPTDGSTTGLTVTDRSVPGPAGWAPSTS
jgi:hypothetical protein